LQTTEKLFAGAGGIESLSEADLHRLEGIVQSEYSRSRLMAGIDVVSFLAETGVLPSKGEARKLIQNGGISINRQKVASVQFSVDARLLLHDQYILVQKGKRNFFLITAK
jgi:tyrosyl-tRNA synthetase